MAAERLGLLKAGKGYFVGERPPSAGVFVDPGVGNGHLHFLAGAVLQTVFSLQVKVHAVHLLVQHRGLIGSGSALGFRCGCQSFHAALFPVSGVLDDAPHTFVAQIQPRQVVQRSGRRPVTHRAGRFHRHHTDSIAEKSYSVKPHALVQQIHRRSMLFCNARQQVHMTLVFHLAHYCFERGRTVALISIRSLVSLLGKGAVRFFQAPAHKFSANLERRFIRQPFQRSNVYKFFAPPKNPLALLL